MRALAAIPAVLLGVVAGGCTPAPVPAVLSFPRSDYDRAFEAALETAREAGLEPVVVDRGLGVIETSPRTAGSVFEPWRTDTDGADQMVAHTVNFERRRARIEFVPQSFAPPTPSPDAPAPGPALAGSDRAEQRFDLLATTGPIDMRAWVFLDRAFTPNQRIGRWSLSEVTVSRDPTDAPVPGDEATRAPTEWTPIGRDVPYEQRLMRRIRELMASPPPEASVVPTSPPSTATDAAGTADAPR